MTKYQRKVLLATSSGIALENMDIMFLAFSLSSMIATFHISGTQAGMIATITNLGMLVGGIFFGLMADKYGRVKVFSQTVILFSIASLLMYFSSTIYLVYLFRFIAGIGAGGEYGACMSLISETFSKKTNWTSFVHCWYWSPSRRGSRCYFGGNRHSMARVAHAICDWCITRIISFSHPTWFKRTGGISSCESN